MSRNSVPPVNNFDGLIVLTVGIGSFVGLAWLAASLGLTGNLLLVGIAVVFGIPTVLTGVAMKLTNRWAWHRQAMRHARALNATRAAAAGS